jgi:hypothetical protein
MSNWEDDEDAYCTTAAAIFRMRAGSATAWDPAASGQLRGSTASGSSRISCANMRPAARRIRTCCATAKSSSASAWTTCAGWARLDRHRPLRPRACTGRGARLLKAADAAKDQSYFLHGIAPRRWRDLVSDRRAAQGRGARLAHAAGLPVFDKPDSTGICFIGERPFAENSGRYLRVSPGPIETDGRAGRRRAPRPGAVHARPALGPEARRARRPPAAYSLKILLENLLRFEDGVNVTRATSRRCSTGIRRPALRARDRLHAGARDHAGLHRRAGIVDLAAMREAIVRSAAIPARQSAGAGRTGHRSLGAGRRIRHRRFAADNNEIEFERNGERYMFLRWGQTRSAISRSCRPTPASCTRSTSSTWRGWCSTDEEGGRQAPIPTRWSAPIRTPPWSTAWACSAGASAASRPRRRCSASRSRC